MPRRLPLAWLGVALLVFFGAACQPITHPTFTVKEGPSSAVTAKLVSGDGNFVLVKATAAGATVPSAGLWRVDRRDGTTVRLPDGYEAFAISRTGDRVLLRFNQSSAPVIWSHGTLVTPPGPAMPKVSADLAFALFVDGAGAVQRLDITTGTTTPVETGVPRPPTLTRAAPLGISDDGNIAHIAYDKPCCSGGVMRFLDIAAHTATDLPFQNGGDITETFTLAARGTAFGVHHLDVYEDPSDPSHTIKNADWVELRNRATGAVLRHYDVPAGRDLYALNISAYGDSIWILQVQWAKCTIQDFTFECFDDSDAVVIRRTGVRSFSTGAGAYVDSFRTTPSGRFTSFAFPHDPFARIPYGPTTIIDWVTGSVEQLQGSVNYQLNDPPICLLLGTPNPCTVPGKGVNAALSDDGVVVVTTSSSGTGWYEYTPAPAPSSPAGRFAQVRGL
jgi:hypothetical protein